MLTWFLLRPHTPHAAGVAATVEVTLDGETHGVDTGFLVFNDRTYPNLIALFAELGVQSHPSEMTFSVSLDEGRLEWAAFVHSRTRKEYP